MNTSQQVELLLSFHPSPTLFPREVNIHIYNPSNFYSQIRGTLTLNSLPPPHPTTHFHITRGLAPPLKSLPQSSNTDSLPPILLVLPTTTYQKFLSHCNPLFSPLSTITSPILSQTANFLSLQSFFKQKIFSSNDPVPLDQMCSPCSIYFGSW